MDKETAERLLQIGNGKDGLLQSQLRNIKLDTFDGIRIAPEPKFEPFCFTTVEERYRDLLQRLGVQGHDGAITEIARLREVAGLK